MKRAPSMDASEAARQAFFSGNSGSVKFSANVRFVQVKSFDRPVAPNPRENVKVCSKEVVEVS